MMNLVHLEPEISALARLFHACYFQQQQSSTREEKDMTTLPEVDAGAQAERPRKPHIIVYSDHVSPFRLLAKHVLSEAIGDRDISIKWRAFELRPEPFPALRVEDGYLLRVWRDAVYPRAEQLGVRIQLPSISPQPHTAKAFKLLAVAQDKGLDHLCSMRVLRAFFQEGSHIRDSAVLIRLAVEASLDAQESRAALETCAYSARHRDALRHAHEDMAITSVPTIVVGERIFRGTPPLDELRRAIEDLETTRAPVQANA